ncbi:MAG: DNA repair protein RecO [Sporichthyaceae bacterium]|nr:DNA repair protein RecO [Sporichthyaceae bacterium]
MSLYRDVGVVLRTHKLGEADRIITVLTRSHGRIRAVGKGVRRTSSRFGSRLEPFTHVDLQFATARSLDVITQAEMLDPFGEPITADYPRYTAGTAMLEVAEKLTDQEREPAVQQYLLLVGGLRALGEGCREPGLVLDSYLLRSLAVAGYAPSFGACVRCGRDGPQPYLNVSAGGAVCSQCRPPGSVAPSVETMSLLAALLSGDWEVAEASQPRSRTEASGIVAAYSQWHLERDVRSFRLVERG